MLSPYLDVKIKDLSRNISFNSKANIQDPSSLGKTTGYLMIDQTESE